MPGGLCESFYAQRTNKLSPKLSPVLSSQASVPLEALKIVARVKGIEPSLSAWEADNEIV